MKNKHEISRQVSSTKRWLGRLAISVSVLIGASSGALAEMEYVPAPPEPGTEIPTATVRLGVLPYADGSMPIIGVKQGFFEDVGITIAPENGTVVTEDQSHSLLMRGDLDVSHNYPPNLLPTYQNSRAVKQIMFHDVIVAGCMLASPSQNLKGIKDYMAEGMEFEEAIAAAMAPVQDKELASTPVANERLFEDTITQLSGVTWKPKILDDPNILVAAKAGQIDFAHPSGAPVVFALLKDGWKQLVCLDDLIAHGPKGEDSPILRSITAVGGSANGNWINENPNTVLRYLSAVWRTIDAVKADPSLYDIQAPVLNSISGTNLTGEDLAATVEQFHPYISYEENAQFYTDETSLLHYKPLYEQIIGALAEAGIVPDDVTPDEFIWGGKLWLQMEDYRKKTDELLAEIDEGSLSEEQKGFVTEARKFYDWHNYLDAYRLTLAASE